MHSGSATVLERCTCMRSGIPCPYHDTWLLHKIAKNIADEDVMWELAFQLKIPHHVPKRCRTDNSASIVKALHEMLRYWYNSSEIDGLGLRSQGLRLLQDAMKNAGQANVMRRVLQGHFDVPALNLNGH